MDAGEQPLQSLGLSSKETTIYLTLLKIGEGSILDISKNCALKRPTIYSGIEMLEKKGLVHLTLRGKRKRFRVEPPTTLRNLLHQKERELEQIIPQLEAITLVPRGTKPVIDYYEGEQAVISLYKSIMSNMDAKAVMYTAASIRDVLTRFPNIVHTFDSLAFKWKWKIQELVPQSKKTEEYLTDPNQPVSKNPNHIHRYLPHGLQLFDIDFMLVNEFLIIISFGYDIFAVTIKSKNIVASFESIFKAAWEISIPIEKP